MVPPHAALGGLFGLLLWAFLPYRPNWRLEALGFALLGMVGFDLLAFYDLLPKRHWMFF